MVVFRFVFASSSFVVDRGETCGKRSLTNQTTTNNKNELCATCTHLKLKIQRSDVISRG